MILRPTGDNRSSVVVGRKFPGGVVDREVRVFDLAATAAYLLDVPTPATWIATPVYEAFEGYLPPPPPRGALTTVLTTNYTLVYDTSGDGTGASTPHMTALSART